MILVYKILPTLCSSNRNFNYWLLSNYINIKHTFKMLKVWSKSLTRLQIFFTNHQQYNYTFIYIIVCIDFYNILLDLNNTWD